MSLDPSFWSNRRVTITGGAGFLGRFVTDRCQKLGATVFVPRSQEFDLVTWDGVRALYETSKPDLVIHLAARVGGIRANQLNPGKFFYDNMMMGVQMIEMARQTGCQKFVTVGTACAYPKVIPVPFQEDDLWHGYPEETNAPYGIAKKALLVQGQAYRAQYNMNIIYLLPANLYGPGDNFDLTSSHVIPALIRKFLEAKEQGKNSVEVWGTGQASREFLYAGDCAEGLLLATQHYNDDAPVNLATGQEIKIKDLVTLISQLCDYQGDIQWNASLPDGQPRRGLDGSRAKNKFGFSPQTSLENGLKQTIEWYKKNKTP